MPSLICAIIYSSNISRLGSTWGKLNMTQPLKHLNNYYLKDESFHNSIDWSRLYLQVYIPPWLEKIFSFTIFIYWKMHLSPPPPPPLPPSPRSYPWHDLIISLLMYNKLSKIFQKRFVPLSAIKITIFQKNSIII